MRSHGSADYDCAGVCLGLGAARKKGECSKRCKGECKYLFHVVFLLQ